jgi:hypothetical protein
MSDPVTPEEHTQSAATLALAEDDELLVSTACPQCHVRFALLVRTGMKAKPLGSFSLAGAGMKFPVTSVSVLRCVLCSWTGEGELK